MVLPFAGVAGRPVGWAEEALATTLKGGAAGKHAR